MNFVCASSFVLNDIWFYSILYERDIAFDVEFCVRLGKLRQFFELQNFLLEFNFIGDVTSSVEYVC